MVCRCLWDTKPRAFDSNSAAILSNFAELVVRELEMNAVIKMQLNMANMLKRAMDCYQQGYLFVNVSSPGWQILHVNQAFTKCTGVCAPVPTLCTAHADLHCLHQPILTQPCCCSRTGVNMAGDAHAMLFATMDANNSEEPAALMQA